MTTWQGSHLLAMVAELATLKCPPPMLVGPPWESLRLCFTHSSVSPWLQRPDPAYQCCSLILDVVPGPAKSQILPRSNSNLHLRHYFKI